MAESAGWWSPSSAKSRTGSPIAFLIKRLDCRQGRWWLRSEHPEFEDIEIVPGKAMLYPVIAILKPTLTSG